MTNSQVETLQKQLVAGKYYTGAVDGLWGKGTTEGVIRLLNAEGRASFDSEEIATLQSKLRQENLYVGAVDGLWGNRTEAAVAKKASMLNVQPVVTFVPDVDPTNDLPLQRALTTPERTKLFGGPFEWIHSPEKGNYENIVIKGNWEEKNIVSVDLPQLAKVTNGRYTKMRWNVRGVKQLQLLWMAWEAHDLLKYILTYDGSYVPRLIRGSNTSLSNHAYGSAFDINYEWNQLAKTPAKEGAKGSVIPLVEISKRFGFFWGGYFSRPDGMHFEINNIIK